MKLIQELHLEKQAKQAKESYFTDFCLVHHLFHYQHRQFMLLFTISCLALLIFSANSFYLFYLPFNSLLDFLAEICNKFPMLLNIHG